MFASLVTGVALLAAAGLFAAPPPKRVLIIHPFNSAAPPFTVHSRAFESALVAKLGERVDLDEISLDMARYAEPEMQEALVEYLQKRQSAWKPDLVVPIGSPAAIFVANYRDRLFPGAPIIYCSLDQRLLPSNALDKNATYVGQVFDIPRLLEDMLQIAPATKNIAVVIGSTPLEQRWKEMFQKASEPLASRINVSYLDDLTFDQMLDRVAHLPPDSFIFILLLLRDAAGVTHNADEALQRMHAVANAPINGIFEHQLGLGVVGGRHYRGELVGEEAAERAGKILHGEPATNFPPKTIDPLPPRYDWRELIRWKIDQKRLPPGSTVLFRTPSVWQQHRGWIIAGVSVCIGEALLIATLLVNLFRRQRAERSLTKSEERIGLAAEAAHLGVWELNVATNQLWVSDQWRSLFQIKPRVPVTADEVRERIHPDDRERRDTLMQKAIEEKGVYEIEYRSFLPDGTLRWVAGRARCVSGRGKSSRLVGVSMDVTERKQAEELFRLATEASPSGTVLVDDHGTIVLVNAHIEELFGYSRDELVGQPIEVLVPDRFRPRHPGHRDGFIAAPEARAMGAGRELFGRRKDASEFPVEIGLNPIQTPQGILVLASVVDISARKAAEKEARHRREQVELLGRASLLGEMTASLAHELNQPLYAIQNNANAAMRFMDKGKIDPVQLREILADVLADGRRAHDIIQNVRNSIKKGSTIRLSMDLNEVVRKVTHMIHLEAAAHSCSVQVSLAEKLPSIEGDPRQMEQVLINLVTNAFDAMRDTPPDLRIVQIATESTGDGTVRIAVRDYGMGIAQGTRERLFEHFFTTKEEGLGMGLAIVRSIVEGHGGKIDVENAQGGGARFHFWLPASEGIPA